MTTLDASHWKNWQYFITILITVQIAIGGYVANVVQYIYSKQYELIERVVRTEQKLNYTEIGSIEINNNIRSIEARIERLEAILPKQQYYKDQTDE